LKDDVFQFVRGSLSLSDSVKNILNNEVYSFNEVLEEEILVQIYNLIRDNEVDHLEL
jgi:hypothetical protein